MSLAQPHSAKLAPAAFFPHGAGPLPLLEAQEKPGRVGHDKFQRHGAQHGSLIKLLRDWGQKHEKPKAAVIISAHYEERVPSIIGSNAAPSLLYDYYGFPEAAYQLTYPAPGAPDLAQHIGDLLSQAGIQSMQEAERGYDHGVFVPLSLVWPQHDVPLAVLSLATSHDPEAHLRLGEALAPLRGEGVAIIGSGLTFHNMRAFRSGDASLHESAEEFDAHLQRTLIDPQLDAAARRQQLAEVLSAPGASDCQPPGQEEHLLPLLVAAGAAGYAPARSIFNEALLGYKTSGFEFA